MKPEKIACVFLYTVYLIFVIAAGILLAGFALIIFYNWAPPEFFVYAFAVVIAEPIGLLIVWTKNIFGLRTGIIERTYTNDKEINEYMKKLISSGSTLDIVSNRLHWVSEDKSTRQKLIERVRSADINIYLPMENQIARELRENGLHIHIVPSLRAAPHARFTLVDKDRPGSAMLAVGAGRIPKFTISEFYEDTHPQVVAMARDYIKSLTEETRSA